MLAKRWRLCMVRGRSPVVSGRGEWLPQVMDGAGEFEESLVEIGAYLVAEAQTRELVQPGQLGRPRGEVLAVDESCSARPPAEPDMTVSLSS
ncbi:hypothetical protein ACH4GP_05815, partial [Streptomyces celluloflavus]